MECSKLILYAIGWILLLVIIYSLVMMAILADLEPLSYILGGLFALANVAVGFYFWKARKENEIKLRLIYGKENTEGIIGTEENGNSEEVVG